jgi:hypothetical protein
MNKGEKKSVDKTKLETKIFYFALIIFLLILHNTIYFHDTNTPNAKDKCIVDKLFDLTEPLNKYVHVNVLFRRALMLISSFIIDTSVISLFIGWAMYSRSWRGLFSVGIFYFFRGVCNGLYAMKYPENMIWENPGIQTFSVSYNDTTDFFFSGHVGINLIASIELTKYKMQKVAYITYLGIIVQITTMLVLRGHYSIDLIAGLIAAHYCNKIVSYKLVHFMDYLFNIDPKVEGCFMTKSEIASDYSDELMLD